MRERELTKKAFIVSIRKKTSLFFLAPVMQASSEVAEAEPQQVSTCLEVAGAVQICNSEGFCF